MIWHSKTGRSMARGDMQQISRSLAIPLQSDGRFRSKAQRGSKWAVRLEKLLPKYLGLGLQIIFSESHSCYHRTLRRIRLLRETKSAALMFDRVFQSTPPLFLSDRDSQMEMKPYTLGIQALNSVYPWMSLGDAEIYLAGWCHAHQVLCRNDSGHRSVE